MTYWIDVTCLVCGKIFWVKSDKPWDGWVFRGLSSLPEHECNKPLEAG